MNQQRYSGMMIDLRFSVHLVSDRLEAEQLIKLAWYMSTILVRVQKGTEIKHSKARCSECRKQANTTTLDAADK
jgi:hypothetical protein